MKIRFKVRGADRVNKYLATVPRGSTRAALQAISMWLIGDSQSGLAHPEPYKEVSRKSAYGVTFFTPKQRRWFFWALNSGEINPGQNNRTGESEGAWKFTPHETNMGYVYKLSNDTPAAFWTRNDNSQARQLKKVGWWTVTKVVKSNMTGALKAGRAAVNEWLKAKSK
jgi:hypothetical protein